MPATADFIPATDATIQMPDFLPAESVKVQGGQSDFIPAEQATALPKDTSEATQGFDVAPGQKVPVERQSTGLAGVGTKLTYDKLPGTVFENRPEGLVETPESAKGAGRNKPLAIPHPQSSITAAARDYTNDVEAEAERVNVSGGARNPFHVMSEQGGTVVPKALDANSTPQEVSQRYQKAKAYLSSEADKIIREGKAYDPAHLVGVDRNKLAMQEAQFRLDEMAKEHVKANPVGATTQGFYSAGQGISQLPQQAIGAAKAAFMDQEAIAERNREAQAAKAIARARREEHPFATSLGFAAGRAISPEMLTTMLAGPVSAMARPAVMTAQGEAEKAASGQPLNPVRGLAENYAMVGMGGVAGAAARGLSQGGTAVQQAIARGAGHAIGGALGGAGVAVASGQNDQEALAQGIAGAALGLGAGAHDIAEPIKAHAEHVAELGKRYPDLTVPERHALAADITRATNQEATNAPTPSNENGGASSAANGNDGNVSKPRSEGAGGNGAAEPVAVPQPTPEEMRPSEFGGYAEEQPGGLTHADAFPKAAGASLEAPAEGRGQVGGRDAAGAQTPEEGAAKAQSQTPAPVPQADHAGVNKPEAVGSGGRTIDLPTALFHGTKSDVTGPLKPGEDGVIWYGTSPEKAKRLTGGKVITESPLIKKVFVTGLTGELSRETMQREADSGIDALYDPDKGHVAYIGHLRSEKESPRAQEATAPKPAVSDAATTPETVKEPAPAGGTSTALRGRAAETSGNTVAAKEVGKESAGDKPDPFANTKAAIRKAMSAAKKAPNPLSGVGLGGLSDVLEHATNISVAVVKDLAIAGKHGFENFVKAISRNIADPRLRAMMLFGERDKTTGKMVGGARDLYNAAREHPDITAHGIEAAMTPADKLPNSMLIAGLAKRTPEQVTAHEAERKAADALPPRPLTEKQTLRAATIEPTETTKGTIARTTGMSDESSTTTEAEALAARLKGEQKAAATGFKLGQKTDTPAEANERITNTIIPPEEKVDVGKAIRVSMTIRAKAEAAIAKLKDTAELSQAVKDQITGFAKELPRDIRADFLTDIKNGKTPADLRRSLARMDTAIEAYNARNALSDLYDTIGKPAKPKGAMPEGKTLAQKINADLVSKPEDPFASGKIDPDKLFPAARDGLSDLVGSLRTAGNPNAAGAAKLADFIQSERDAGHSNDGGMTEAQIERLRGMEGKPVKNLSTEDRNLLTQAIRHAAHLGEQYNEARAGSRLRAVRDAVRSAIDGMYHYHPEPLKAGSRAGGVEAEPRKNPLAQFMGNALRRPFQFLKLNFGKQGEKWWRAIVDSHTSVLGAKQSAADLVTSLMNQHGITDAAWRKMSETQRDIDLGDGQRIRMTPREVMSFYKQWGDSETARKMVRDGFVPDRISGDPHNNKTITPASAQKIIDTMTPGEKAIADAIQKHFTSGKLHADANKESVNEFGYEKLTRTDYMPRSVAREQQGHGVPESLSNMQDRLLKDAGFLKERTGGNAPVVIRDIGDAFNEHVDKLSRFAYQNGPIRDVLIAANNPEFHAETLNRIGSGWQKTLTNFLRTAAGLHEPVTFPGSRLANDARSRLATGELFFRATSALNHFLGGMLSLNALPDGASSSFLKNFALRAFPNMASVRDMEARDPYLRDRGEHGYAALDTPVDTPHAKGAFGRALDAVGNVGTAHIRLSDRLDSNAIYRTLTETYKKNNPGATEDAARNWAAHETGIIQRKTGTASTPLEHSEMSQNLSRIPVANMLSLFQTKTSAMRNVVDEAYHDWRAEKSTQNAAKFAKAAASVAFMTATYAGVGIAARALMHGLPITKDKKKEFAESEAINIAAHIADLVTPGIGGTLVRGIGEAITTRGEFGGNLATDTINRVMQGIKRIGSDSTKGTTAKTIEDVAGLLNDLGKFIGVSAEQPTDIGYGIYHHMAGDIHTDKDRRTAEKEDNGFVKHERPPRNNR